MRVTFFFTDVEGSTRLLREHGDGYARLLAEHRATIRSACARHGGREIDTQGDAFFFVFDSPRDAAGAAAEAQAGLAAGPIRVRIGIHTGDVLAADEGYVGLELHKAARIAAAGHGGQTVLSSETCLELAGELELLDLGEHRVKDFDESVSLLQLGSSPFPPLRTIANTNLPRPASSFVGRERELAELRRLVRSGERLVTITGPGGSGKTRLAIEAASELLGDFRAGVFWVGLAAIPDGALVLEEIARTIGGRDDLPAHISEREILLVLDNLEQAIDAAPALADVVEQCPNLHLLVTSREVLRVRGEIEFELTPLTERDCVELFWQRARLTGRDAEAAALCRALDNLPLAVELAAARARVLTPAQMLERIEQRLDLLKGGRDAHPRHRTLRATIDWSYELLQPEERELHGRLSIFPAGCTLEAAEEVVDAELDVLQALVEKSLVRHTEGRFWMLQTIQGYAAENWSGDDRVSRRYTKYFLGFVLSREPEFAGPGQTAALREVEIEYPNIRAALARLAATGETELLLTLLAALRHFFFKKGYLSEGRRLLTAALAASDEETPVRAAALTTAALLAVMQRDFAESELLAVEGRRLGLEMGAAKAAGGSMLVLGRALLARGAQEEAVATLEEAARLGAETGDDETVAMSGFNLAYAQFAEGHLAAAERRFAEVAARPNIDPYIAARAHAALGSVALRAGRDADAEAHLRRSLTLLAELEHRDDTLVWALELLGAALAGSEPERAAFLLGAAEALRTELGVALIGLELEQHEQVVASLETTLGPDGLAARWAAGRVSDTVGV